MELALTLHKTSYSMAPCCYLPKARSWFWALPAFVALASSCRASHTRLGARCLARGWNARSVSEQRATLINHWTPAFPAFYVALAVPVGAWTKAGHSELESRLRWILPVRVAIALLVLGWCDLIFISIASTPTLRA